MRSALLLIIPIVLLAGCKKTTVSTAPAVTDNLSLSGAWTGCIVEPQAPCALATMTLSDSAVTDSSANVYGTGDWEDLVSIKGRLVDTKATLSATAQDVAQGWSYTATMSGDSLVGTMIIPDAPSSYPATFTRSK